MVRFHNVIFNVMSVNNILHYLYFVLLWCYDDLLFSDFNAIFSYLQCYFLFCYNVAFVSCYFVMFM